MRPVALMSHDAFTSKIDCGGSPAEPAASADWKDAKNQDMAYPADTSRARFIFEINAEGASTTAEPVETRFATVRYRAGSRNPSLRDAVFGTSAVALRAPRCNALFNQDSTFGPRRRNGVEAMASLNVPIPSYLKTSPEGCECQ